MSLEQLKPLRCPRCGGPSDLPTWLDHARTKVLEHGTVPVDCPRCRTDLQLEVKPGHAAIGSLSETTPRMFRPETRIAQADLTTSGSPDALKVVWQRREWWFQKRPPVGS